MAAGARTAADTQQLVAAEAELGLLMPDLRGLPMPHLRAWWRLDDVDAAFWIPSSSPHSTWTRRWRPGTSRRSPWRRRAAPYSAASASGPGCARVPALRRLHRRRPPGRLAQGGNPDAWPLIFWSRHADQGPALEGGLVDTLLAWQRGGLVAPGPCGLDEDDDPVEFAGFEPWEHGGDG